MLSNHYLITSESGSVRLKPPPFANDAVRCNISAATFPFSRPFASRSRPHLHLPPMPFNLLCGSTGGRFFVDCKFCSQVHSRNKFFLLRPLDGLGGFSLTAARYVLLVVLENFRCRAPLQGRHRAPVGFALQQSTFF